ncbi:MAG: excinuclease ABC subunit UvrB [Bacilli bacterium]|nr:excinuclease ABC subunit UvrB [Bacilli bacterium]
MFKLESKYKPSGDQPQAIESLVNGIKNGEKYQVLLGATGTGKTFTIANVIEKVQKPTLVLAHNKTLAGQLYAELKELFPHNHVCYFVSYYDYYQPEAYVAKTDTYIEKDASINDEIDELRHYATSSLLNYDDVIVVSSVSCIYGIGEIEEYKNKMLTLSVNDKLNRDDLLMKLIDMLYERNDIELKRGTFRVRGDILEIMPINQHGKALRIDFFGDEIDNIYEYDTVTGALINSKKSISLFPASHFVTNEDKLKLAIKNIKIELEQQLEKFKKENKLLEYQRLKERTNYDLEMLSETGTCRGVENYSRHLALKEAGATPTTLIDFFQNNFLLVVDESHVTLPQVRGMYNGDQARKKVLVDYGFRLPSAMDNRPLKYEEFEKKIDQMICISATPGDYEIEKANGKIIEQIIRPTGLLDPKIKIKPTLNQIDDLIEEITEQCKNNERTLITTLTIRMAEELTNYLKQLDIKVAYLHSEVKTLERLEIIRDLRIGKYDVLVGINLLREGLDIPEVSLVAIMDADKQGFLRSEKSLIQTIGRAARNSNGRVIMYADVISDSMNYAIKETERRRNIQEEYNKKNNIIPKTIIKDIKEVVSNNKEIKQENNKKLTKTETKEMLNKLEEEMRLAAAQLDFERAMELRDIIFEMKSE